MIFPAEFLTAKNTGSLIEGTVGKIRDGSELVTVTNEAFNEVADSSAKVGSLVAEISAASNEQAQGIDQVGRAITDMNGIVQNAAASAEESASVSEEMYAQAEQLKSAVKELVALVGDDKNTDNRREHQKKHRGHTESATNTDQKIQKRYGESQSASKPKAPEMQEMSPLDNEEFKDF